VILFLATVYGAGIYCTLTRVVWLAAVGGSLLLALLGRPTRQRLVVSITVGLLLALLLAAQWERFNAFKRDRYVSVAEMTQSASLRPILAYVAWQMFLDRPLLGCGYRQYQRESAHYLGDRSVRMNLERGRGFVQHNGFLSLLTETGLVGLGLFVLILAVLAQMSWRLWRAEEADWATRQWGLLMLPALFAYVVMAMFHDLALIPMIHTLLFFLAGVTRCLATRAGASATERGHKLGGGAECVVRSQGKLAADVASGFLPPAC
jgi:O-antigen ligase